MTAAFNPGNGMAPPVSVGVEDNFYYVISDACILCGACAADCPTEAVREGEEHFEIDASKCIDCGTCAAICPVGAPAPV